MLSGARRRVGYDAGICKSIQNSTGGLNSQWIILKQVIRILSEVTVMRFLTDQKVSGQVVINNITVVKYSGEKRKWVGGGVEMMDTMVKPDWCFLIYQ